ncbi:hypothetical protein [Caballeronia sp. LZ035]|uniref:hypothetical protein n=1 Tax=Caballeronia sp. LZ035 TaxID=3038568 RepID=UPI00285A98B2|nr:hypothetical protein [Caballeronia sp. LZ035]MDR5756529.1 hypothetical protein [Caballeronia sp. LZ035]
MISVSSDYSKSTQTLSGSSDTSDDPPPAQQPSQDAEASSSQGSDGTSGSGSAQTDSASDIPQKSPASTNAEDAQDAQNAQNAQTALPTSTAQAGQVSPTGQDVAGQRAPGVGTQQQLSLEQPSPATQSVPDASASTKTSGTPRTATDKASADMTSRDLADSLVLRNDLAAAGDRFNSAVDDSMKDVRDGKDTTDHVIAAGRAFDETQKILGQTTLSRDQQDRSDRLAYAFEHRQDNDTPESISKNANVDLKPLTKDHALDDFNKYGKYPGIIARSALFDEGRFNNSQVLKNWPVVSRFQTPGQSRFDWMGPNGRLATLLGARGLAATNNFSKAGSMFMSGIQKLKDGKDPTDDFVGGGSAMAQGLNEVSGGAGTDIGNHLAKQWQAKQAQAARSEPVSSPGNGSNTNGTAPAQNGSNTVGTSPAQNGTNTNGTAPAQNGSNTNGTAPAQNGTNTNGTSPAQNGSNTNGTSPAQNGSNTNGTSPAQNGSNTNGTSPAQNGTNTVGTSTQPSGPSTSADDARSIHSLNQQVDADLAHVSGAIDGQVADRQKQLKQDVFKRLDGTDPTNRRLILQRAIPEMYGEYSGMQTMGDELKKAAREDAQNAHDNLLKIESESHTEMQKLNDLGFQTVEAARKSENAAARDAVSRLDHLGQLKHDTYDQFDRAMNEREALMKDAPTAYRELGQAMNTPSQEVRQSQIGQWMDKYGENFSKYQNTFLANTETYPDWFKISKPLRTQLVPSMIGTAFGAVGFGASLHSYLQKQQAGTLTVPDKLNLGAQVLGLVGGIVGFVPFVGPVASIICTGVGAVMGGIADGYDDYQRTEAQNDLLNQYRDEWNKRHAEADQIEEPFDGG